MAQKASLAGFPTGGDGGGGLFFRWGTSFLNGVWPMGGIGFDGDGFQKKL